MKVIVAGLPRTGTTSMTAALCVLLNDTRVFDGGSLSFSGSKQEQNQLLEFASRAANLSHSTQRKIDIHRLAALTKGYVASSDQPGCFFVEELLELYPGAKVIATTRERESWWASYTTLQKSIAELYPLSWLDPQLHRFCKFSVQFWRRVPHQVGLPPSCEDWWDMQNHEQLYDAHAEYLKRVVPEECLFYFNVKQGWGPLCDILDLPVPDQPFPHEFPRAWLATGVSTFKRKVRWRLAFVSGLFVFFGSWVIYAVKT